MTFDTFDVRGNNGSAAQRTSLENALESARGYASDPDGWGWLTLFGETGVGKTHLAVAIAAWRKARGQPMFFTFVPDLMDYLRSTFRPDSGVAYDRVFDRIKNAPLLIMDHLSSDHLSDWAYEKLYQIIVHRHNSRIPTVITSPMDMADSSGPHHISHARPVFRHNNPNGRPRLPREPQRRQQTRRPRTSQPTRKAVACV